MEGDADGSIRWDAVKIGHLEPENGPDDAADDAADDAPGSEPAPDDAPAPEPAADAKPARKRKRKTKQPAEEAPAEERLPWAPPPKGTNKKPAAERDAVAAPTAVKPAEAVHEAEGEAAPVAGTEMETDMSSWSQLGLHPELLARLAERGFARPTPIQEACLPPALHGRRDIVGAAETGSGKTLAFGLPILQRWLETRDKGEAREGLFGLIITPTRELALQVADHLRALMPLPDATCARVVTLVGGMAVVKQKRQLQVTSSSCSSSSSGGRHGRGQAEAAAAGEALILYLNPNPDPNPDSNPNPKPDPDPNPNPNPNPHPSRRGPTSSWPRPAGCGSCSAPTRSPTSRHLTSFASSCSTRCTRGSRA
eukprot:scaffold135642_cov48-Phaeocystis_antarctica.AAC.2